MNRVNYFINIIFLPIYLFIVVGCSFSPPPPISDVQANELTNNTRVFIESNNRFSELLKDSKTAYSAKYELQQVSHVGELTYRLVSDEHGVNSVIEQILRKDYLSGSSNWQIAYEQSHGGVLRDFQVNPYDSNQMLVWYSDNNNDVSSLHLYNKSTQQLTMMSPSAINHAIWVNKSQFLFATTYQSTKSKNDSPTSVKLRSIKGVESIIFNGSGITTSVTLYSNHNLLGFWEWRSDLKPVFRVVSPEGIIVTSMERNGWQPHFSFGRHVISKNDNAIIIYKDNGDSEVVFQAMPNQVITSMLFHRSHGAFVLKENGINVLYGFRISDGVKYSPISINNNYNLAEMKLSSLVDANLEIEVSNLLTPPTRLMFDLNTKQYQIIASVKLDFDLTKTHELSIDYAKSKDGTMVPYIKCINKNNPKAPILTYVYGAFNWSNLPYFDPRVAELWLKRGGSYILAWPRGGGELGLKWHKAAVKLNKHKTKEDLVAILKQLKAYFPQSKQGLMGASAGGWLVSLVSTQHPELIDATLVQVPVTDVGNLHKYTSKAYNQDSEFGDTSLAQNEAYYQAITPMNFIKPDKMLPATYVLGVREDLRAPVIHARKLVESYRKHGHDIHYYEETKGGHSSNLNNYFNAVERAYYFTFLWNYLD